MKMIKSLHFIPLISILGMHQLHAEECIYSISEEPQVVDKRIDVFLGLNSDPVRIENIDSVSSITVQKSPFRIVLFDEPNDSLTITTTENENHKYLFAKLLEIKDVCSKESLAILNEFIGGVKGNVVIYISKDTSSFQFWGKDRYLKANSFTSFYKVQSDIFVVSRTTKG